MAARHTARKAISQAEREVRQHHSDVRHLKKWCERSNTFPKTWDQAELSDVCVLSRSEYDLREERISVIEDNESYFLSHEDYEMWCDDESW